MFLLRNVLALCLVALLFAAPVRAQDAKPAAALFSQDTFLYLEIDTKAFDHGVRQLDLAKMLADPKLRELFGPLLEKVGANVEDPIAALLQHVPARAWVDGKIAIGIRGFNLTMKKADGTLERDFIGPGNPLKAVHLHRLIGAGILNASRGAAGISNSPDVMIVVSPGVNSKQMVPALLAEPPIPLEQSDVEVAGRMVKRVKLPDMNGLMGADLFIDMTGERWIISSNKATLQTALDGSMRSPLNQWAPFKEARERFTAENNIVFAYADASAVVDMVRNLVPPILLESARLQGLDSIRGVCLGMSMTEGGIRESIGFTLKGEATGWFKLLDAFPGGMAGLRAAPAKTAGYIGARFDAKLFVERLDEVLAEVYPGSESVLQLGFSRVKLQTGFDIKQEILDALGDEAMILVYPPRGFLPVPDWTVSLAVRDQEKFKALLEKLKVMAAALGVPLQPIQLDDGSEAMQILLPPTIPMLPPVLTLHGDRLLISSADDILMRSTRKAAEGQEPLPRLASGEVFQKVMRGLSKGDDSSLVALVYLDNKAMVPPLLERARALGSLIQGFPIDLAKLNPQAFVPHLSGMAIALRRDTKAISIDVFSPMGLLVVAGGTGAMYATQLPRALQPTPVRIEEEVVMPPMPVRDAEEPFVGFNADSEGEGLLLTGVIEGTPAHTAGLQVGDRIVGFNDAAIADFETFREQIMKHKAGETVTLKIKRAGDEMAIVLKLGRRGDHVK